MTNHTKTMVIIDLSTARFSSYPVSSLVRHTDQFWPNTVGLVLRRGQEPALEAVAKANPAVASTLARLRSEVGAYRVREIPEEPQEGEGLFYSLPVAEIVQIAQASQLGADDVVVTFAVSAVTRALQEEHRERRILGMPRVVRPFAASDASEAPQSIDFDRWRLHVLRAVRDAGQGSKNPLASMGQIVSARAGSIQTSGGNLQSHLDRAKADGLVERFVDVGLQEFAFRLTDKGEQTLEQLAARETAASKATGPAAPKYPWYIDPKALSTLREISLESQAAATETGQYERGTRRLLIELLQQRGVDEDAAKRVTEFGVRIGAIPTFGGLGLATKLEVHEMVPERVVSELVIEALAASEADPADLSEEFLRTPEYQALADMAEAFCPRRQDAEALLDEVLTELMEAATAPPAVTEGPKNGKPHEGRRGGGGLR
jgi:hypothetical protein